MPNFVTIQRVVELFLASEEPKLLYQLPSEGEAANFVHGFNRIRKRISSNEKKMEWNRLHVFNTGATVTLEIALDLSGLPAQGVLTLPDGTPFNPRKPSSAETAGFEEDIQDFLQTLGEEENE